MVRKNRRYGLKQSTCIAASIAFIGIQAYANPVGPQVASGAAVFQQPSASTLNVTNSPGAIINWQGFSIGQNEITRFIQQSASSAVLNRVVGADISQIHGQLLSNGRVFLINPSGIVIGPGAVIDTAGFVASTLNMLDGDFLTEKLRFQGNGESGSIVNQGLIRTGYDGQVMLVAPHIENSGLIHTPGGEIILAAGRRLEITSLDHEGVQFEVQAPTGSVINVGKLLADGGAIGVFAGTLRHSGEIRANALAFDEAGHVILQAKNELQITAGSITSANGNIGGGIVIESGGLNRVAGAVSATGATGRGGDIQILGDRVSLAEAAAVDASGATGGGQIRVGGDYQGANPDVHNASTTFVSSLATLKADATQSGDGGRIIVWSDQSTQFYGSLSARGGPTGGNGGFAEVSGKENLIFAGSANLGAALGTAGTLLLDPLDLYVFDDGGLTPVIIDEPADFPGNAATVSPATLAAIVGNVTLYASRYMRISDDINLTTVEQSLTATVGTWTPPALPDPLAMSEVPNRLDIAADITTNGGAVSLSAPNIWDAGESSTITTAGGAISLTTLGTIDTPGLALDAGSGAVNVSAAQGIYLSNITGGGITLASSADQVATGDITGSGTLSINSGGDISTGNIISGAAATLTSGAGIQTGSIFTNGGTLTATAGDGAFYASGTIDTRPGQVGATGGTVSITADDSYGYYAEGFVQTQAINAGNANVSLTGESIYTNGEAIDTTGNVTLTAVHNDLYAHAQINARINNAASVTANANNQGSGTSGTGYSAIINIGSDTVLNATTVTATTTDCLYYGSCGGANITLSGDLGVNVGTITAAAPVSFNNTYNYGAAYADPRYENINESVNISSAAGSILALSGTSLITAADVTLSTIPGDNAATGGDILGFGGGALQVSAERNFIFKVGGDFDVDLLGAGPNRLDIQLGVAPAAGTWSGTLSGAGANGVTLSASATDGTVTVSNFTLTGFDQRVFNQSPNVSLYVPNGNLVATTVAVPKGDNTGSSSPAALYNCATYGGSYCPPAVTYESLPVTLRAFGDLSVTSYTRAGSGADLAKSTTFYSDGGDIALGTINAFKDSVNVYAYGSDISVTNLNTAGNVFMYSASGDITIGLIDTTSGSGSVTLQAAVGIVKATSDSAALEISSGGAISINATTLGDAAFTNPLDLAAPSVVLSSQNSGVIGFAAAPVIANTQNLTIDATNGSTFNVSTGAIALKNLSVTANPVAVGATGLARVTSEAFNYDFDSDGTDFTFNPVGIPVTQFLSGQLSLATTSGNIDLPGNLDLGLTGSLSLTAKSGSISTLDLDAAAVTLRAEPSYVSYNATPVSITTGNIGATIRPNTLTIQAGNYYRPGYVQTGAIEAGAVTITSYGALGPSNDSINVGNIGATTRAGAVSLVGNYNWQGGAGDIQAGDITASSIYLFTSQYYATGEINAGNLNATSSISAYSDLAITTGTLDAASINLGAAYCCYPSIAVGAIGGTTAPNSVNITGSTVDIDGAVSGDSTAEDTINLYANGLLTVSGAITGGDGSTITLTSNGATPFQFTEINAGATGTVSITSANGIEQTSDDTGSNGITAQTVILNATDGDIFQSVGVGDTNLNLFGVKNLTIEAGDDVALNAQGSTLDFLSITTHGTTPDAASIELVNMGGSQSLAVTDNGSGDFNLALTSPTLLDFSFTATATGIRTSGGGIVTNGGDVTLNAVGVFNGTLGGITTGGGNVSIYAEQAISTGQITTVNGAIDIYTNVANTDIVVSGNLSAGSGAITLTTYGADSYIERSGGSVISSATSVSLSAADGSIGTVGTPMLITAPSVTLDARDPFDDGIQGYVFATLTSTSDLVLRGDNGFTVASDTALSTLDLSTLGTRTGDLILTATGQSYSLTRPATDLFANPITDTLEIGPVTGTSLSSATFHAVDGDLLVRGGTTIAATTLNLLTSVGDIELQGNNANPLVLNNTTQNFTAGQALRVSGKVALTAVDQTLAAGYTISLTGGAANGENITVSATGNQVFQVFNADSEGGIFMQAGAGDNASILVQHSGSGNQTLRADGNITLIAGDGVGSTLQIENLAGHQYLDAEYDILLQGGGVGANATAKIVNSSTTGNQYIGNTFGYYYDGRFYTTNSITLQGGSGSGASAIVESTVAGMQQVFETSGMLLLQGGSGADATAIATSQGTQQLGWSYYYNIGNALGSLALIGGAGAGAYALATTPAAQQVWAYNNITLQSGNATSQGIDAYAALSANSQAFYYGNVALGGGTQSGNYARIQSATTQYFDIGNLSLTGGSAATTDATITAPGTQTFYTGNITLTGAASEALIQSTGAGQSFSGGNVVLTGGTQSGAYARIQSATTQYFDINNLSLTGGSALNAAATINALDAQTFYTGSISLIGGSGSLAVASISSPVSQYFSNGNVSVRGGTVADAVASITAPSQTIDSYGSVNVTGDVADAEIKATGNGLQTVSAAGGILLEALVAGGDATLSSGGAQTLTASNGEITVRAFGTGNATLSAAGDQTVRAYAVDVRTVVGSSGNATLSATGNQWIHTTNSSTAEADSIRVAALGSGTASITSGASQLLELDYPYLMQGSGGDGVLTIGDANAAGTSLIQAVDQNVFAGSIRIIGGLVGSISKLSASNDQKISTVLGGIEVLGGPGDNSLATIDPLTQTILANGSIILTGGDGFNADASIISGGAQTIVTTNGGFALTGGIGNDADAFIQTSALLQTIGTTGDIIVTQGSGVDADALFIVGNGQGTLAFACGGTCTLTSFNSDPTNNGAEDAGVFGNPLNVTLDELFSIEPEPDFTFDAPTLLYPLDESQDVVIEESEPDEGDDDADPKRRKIPRCC